MKLYNKKKKGFTLIELLIVVVIIGILAALILPRLLAQPERAAMAEGMNYLGTLKRAMVNYADTDGSGTFLAVDSTAPAGGWRTIGLQPLPATSRFAYVCTGGVPSTANLVGCTATRANVPAGNAFVGATMSMIIAGATEGTIACGGTGQTAYVLNATSGQCTV